MADRFMRECVISLLITFCGALLFSIVCSLEYYSQYNDHYHTWQYILTHILFWCGLILFITGILSFVRLIIMRRRNAYLGAVISRNPPSEDSPVTVVQTVYGGMSSLTYQTTPYRVQQPSGAAGYPFYQQDIPPDRQTPNMPQVPPSYEESLKYYTK